LHLPEQKSLIITEQNLCHGYLKKDKRPKEVSKHGSMKACMCVIYLRLKYKIVIYKTGGFVGELNKEGNGFRQGKRSLCPVCKIPGHNILVL